MVGLIFVIFHFIFKNSHNEKLHLYSILIFFFFISNCFQLIPLNFVTYGVPGITKSFDFALIILFFSIIFELKKWRIMLKRIKHLNALKLLLVFSLITSLFSYFILEYKIINIFRVARPYFLLLSVYFFYLYKIEVLEKAFRFILFLTIFLSILYLLQIPFNRTLIETSGSEMTIGKLDGIDWIRYYNLPVFLSISFIFLLFNNKIFPKKYRILFQIILGMTIIAPAHRSYIGIFLLVISIYFFIKTNLNKKIIITILIVFVMIFLSSFGFLNKIIMRTFSDLKFITSLNFRQYDIMNTFSYRIMHFFERATYILTNPNRWILGLGFITEDSVEAQHLSFNIGIEDKLNPGKITQIDTGDIIWSLLILQGGIVGILLNINFIYSLLIFFKKLQKEIYSQTGLLYILICFFLSFFSSEMIGNGFRTITLLFFIIVYKKNETQYSFTK